MKKLLEWLLCVMILVFGVTLSVQAYAICPIDAGHIDLYGGIYLGSTDDLVAFGWNDCSTYHSDQDKSLNIANTLELLNITNNPDYALLNSPYVEVETGYPIDYTGGTIRWNGEFQFLSMKWDRVFGLLDARGLTAFAFSELTGNNPDGNALSHCRLWNPTSVPEPATMFLLGAGLLGLALFGRQRFKR